MPLQDIDRPEYVLAAIREFEELGRATFLATYGFGRSRGYELVFKGKSYDSKAIIGVAHGFARPDLGPLSPDQFSGGAATVQSRLEQLGFELRVDRIENIRPHTSDWLVDGEVYTRDELKTLIETEDSTINTGVFRPRGTASIWLFVTKDKPADRTQYLDEYTDGLLHWQGQTQGRTDDAIIHHRARGDELVVFYRDRKYEHALAGFRCLGTFDYLSHSGGKPTHFILRSTDLSPPAAGLGFAGDGNGEPFDIPHALEPDGPTMVKAETMARRGQGIFRYRVSLLEPSCRLTGVDEPAHLRASHIKPWAESTPNERLDGNNGLFLAPHVDHLFDRGLISFRDNGMLLTSQCLSQQVLDRWSIREPTDVRPFSSSQCEYLQFHRHSRFQS